MRVTFTVTIPGLMKLELCPLITAIFLITGGFSARIARPYVERGIDSTVGFAGRAVVTVAPILSRSVRMKGIRRRQTQGTCGGSTNGCWTGDFSIETDTDTSWPNTGVTVEYNLTMTNSTCSPEGVPKPCILINGQSPGPTLTANWGDMIKVNLYNQLQDNGTSMHWHGLRQLGTNVQDGVNGLTECPLAPGQQRTYEFQATTYGTTWYHSHFSAQYGDGVRGPMVINGPSTAGYDYDMGPIAISELYKGPNGTAAGAATYDAIISTQGPLTDVPTNILFNGINVDATGAGTHLEYEFVPGAKHLMRFINTGVDNHYKVGIDGHMMQVVAIDLTPVQPYMADYVSLGVGQRFEAIVTANGNDTSGAYWLRAVPTACAMNMYDGLGVQNVVIRYKGSPAGLPTTKATISQNQIAECLDETPVPFVAKPVNASTFDPYHLPIASPSQVTTTSEGRVFRWTLGKTTQVVDWQSPILQRFIEGNTTVSPEDNIIGVDQDGWAYWYLQNNFYEAHPIHMHGNDLTILSTGPGQWNESKESLNFATPMRRDTFMLPAGGYAILAFQTDNPGIWLMHCHIAWHASEGLSTSLYVKKDNIKIDKVQSAVIQDQCKVWDQYINGYGIYAAPGSANATMQPGANPNAQGGGIVGGGAGGAAPNAAIIAAAGGARYGKTGSGVK